MRATSSWLGALLAAALVPGVAPAQFPPCPTPRAPDLCGPGFYTTNAFGLVFGPNYNVYPPFGPFQGLVFGPCCPPGCCPPPAGPGMYGLGGGYPGTDGYMRHPGFPYGGGPADWTNLYGQNWGAQNAFTLGNRHGLGGPNAFGGGQGGFGPLGPPPGTPRNMTGSGYGYANGWGQPGYPGYPGGFGVPGGPYGQAYAMGQPGYPYGLPPGYRPPGMPGYPPQPGYPNGYPQYPQAYGRPNYPYNYPGAAAQPGGWPAYAQANPYGRYSPGQWGPPVASAVPPTPITPAVPPSPVAPVSPVSPVSPSSPVATGPGGGYGGQAAGPNSPYGNGQASFPTHCYARSPRDFFMID